jgi:hypothetical protein
MRQCAQPFDFMARLAGIEPATLGLEGRCSIQLSYRRVPELSLVTDRGATSGDGIVPGIAREPARNILEASRTDDVLTIEHAAGLVARHRHCDALRYSGVDHIAHCAPPHVVPEHPWHARFPARGGPRLLEVTAALSEHRDAASGGIALCLQEHPPAQPVCPSSQGRSWRFLSGSLSGPRPICWPPKQHRCNATHQAKPSGSTYAVGRLST